MIISKEQQDYYNSPEFEARMNKASAEYPELSESEKCAAAENVEHLMDMDGADQDPENWLNLYSASLEGIQNEK